MRWDSIVSESALTTLREGCCFAIRARLARCAVVGLTGPVMLCVLTGNSLRLADFQMDFYPQAAAETLAVYRTTT